VYVAVSSSTVSRQSASTSGSVDSVVTGMRDSATRRLPQSESIVTTPRRERSGWKSSRFASK
jgi:hypothetical protein